MELDGAVDRRTLLAGALGTAGLMAAGCSTPPAPTPEVQDTTKPSPLITSVRPRPQPPKAPKHATAREIIKRATVPVLCYHQLRNWTSSDGQYNRVNLICPPENFHAHLDALAENGWTTTVEGRIHDRLPATGQETRPRRAVDTLRRSLVVSTWSGATLLQHLKKHDP